MKRLYAWFPNFTVRFTVYGFIFGLCTPVSATLADILIHRLPFDMAQIVQVQRAQPLHWLIDLTPLAVSLFGRWLGKRQDRLVEITAQLEQTVAERTLTITQSNEALKVENAERLRAEEI
ncbi:MAG TPA: hypothetical protein VF823_03525, partial [Anaerolineales bacterium]